MQQLHKFWGLCPADRRLLLQAGWLIIAIRLGLWLLPFRTLRRTLARVARPHAQARPSQPPIERIVWAVTVASSFVPAATCLTQALGAQTLLMRRSYAVVLRIGVARDERGQFEAHAWLESNARVVFGGTGHDLASYTLLPSLEFPRP